MHKKIPVAASFAAALLSMSLCAPAGAQANSGLPLVLRDMPQSG